MRPGRRGRREGGREGEQPSRAALSFPSSSESVLRKPPTWIRSQDPRCSRRLYIFGALTTDRSDRSIDGRTDERTETLNGNSFSRM